MWWHTVTYGRGSEGETGEWSGLASTLHTTSEHGVSSITTADAHTSAASSRLNWRPLADLNGLVRFAEKTKSGFCACAVTFQLASTLGILFTERPASVYTARADTIINQLEIIRKDQVWS